MSKHRRLHFFACLIAWATTTTTTSALAQPAPEPITLEWNAPSGCPDRDSVRALLRERLPPEHVNVPLHARARITQEAHGFRLDIELATSEQGLPASRSLRNAQCAQLAEAAVVLIALAVSVREAPAAAPESQPEPNRELNRELEPEPQPSATPSSAERAVHSGTDSSPDPQVTTAAGSSSVFRGLSQPLHLQLSAAARTAIAVFPQQLALAVQAQLAVRSAPLYAALGFSYWFPGEGRSASYPRALLKGSGAFADVSLGADVTLASLVLTPALCLELGRLDAQATGVNGPEASHTFWLAAGAAASLSFSLFRSWFVAIDVAGLHPLTHIRWLVRAPGGDVQAFSAAPFTARISLRLGYTLW